MIHLSSTPQLGAFFLGSEHLSFYGFSDSDWAADFQVQESTSTYVMKMGGGAFRGCPQKQTVVSTCPHEAENLSLRADCKVAMWLWRVI